MYKYVRILLIVLLFLYLLMQSLMSFEAAGIFVLSVFMTALLFHPEQLRRMDLEATVMGKEMFIDSIKDEALDFAFQLFNLRPSLGIDRAGYVYILKSDKGFYKIGRTSNPDNRLRTFNVRLPMHVNYEVLIKTSDMNGLEAHFHKQFQHKHESGEWFRLVHNDLRWLKHFPGALTDEELAAYNTKAS